LQSNQTNIGILTIEDITKSPGGSIVADIRIEKKSRNIWPWVIGIIAILLIAAGVIYALNREGVIDIDNDSRQDQYQEQPMNQPPAQQQPQQQQPQTPPPAGP
jgi:hypothetical protein